jgi:hypothetical protein
MEINDNIILASALSQCSIFRPYARWAVRAIEEQMERERKLADLRILLGKDAVDQLCESVSRWPISFDQIYYFAKTGDCDLAFGDYIRGKKDD